MVIAALDAEALTTTPYLEVVANTAIVLDEPIPGTSNSVRPSLSRSLALITAPAPTSRRSWRFVQISHR
jgi:hypothetical protein